jgi:hypothetical protein
MSPEAFTYWLQGFFEISGSENLSEKQVRIIKDHLNLVFQKVSPNRENNEVDFSKICESRVEESEVVGMRFC